jgi:hypothetical protein
VRDAKAPAGENQNGRFPEIALERFKLGKHPPIFFPAPLASDGKAISRWLLF